MLTYCRYMRNKFVNTIAESIEQDYPSVRVETLAYQYSRKPPKTLRPRRNVVIRLCCHSIRHNQLDVWDGCLSLTSDWRIYLD
ncbi:MAG: DUF4838 domain-containing protein [Candidatus Brockarchaeota archaeon]|nr:DUF4838 domain-containing protein [Candidatus Brockarchaeota archaeon]